MNITILGCGAYALALAQMARENNCNIRMWSKLEEEVNNLKDKYRDILFTNDLKEALEESEFIIIAIPIEYLESTTKELSKYHDNQEILIATKGISQKNNMFATDIISRYIACSNIGVISGGTFAIDMMNKNYMGLTLATESSIVTRKTYESIKCKYLEVETTVDLLGVQICGSIKNVIAIGCGIIDALNFSESTKTFFLTKSIYEIRNIIIGLGGDKDTIITHAGINDIMLTCSSSKSRNFTLGSLLVNGSKEEINNYKKNNTIEGFYTVKSIYELAKRRKIKIPIIEIIYNILYKNKDVSILVDYLKQKP